MSRLLKPEKDELQAQAQDLADHRLKQKVMTESEARLTRTPHSHAGTTLFMIYGAARRANRYPL